MTKRQRPGKPGRPRKLGAAAVDPTTFNPRAVLAGIAADPESPPTARVMACKALLRLAEDTDPADDGEIDELTRKALVNMRKRRDD